MEALGSNPTLLQLTTKVYKAGTRYLISLRGSSTALTALLAEIRQLKAVLKQLEALVARLEPENIFNETPSALLSLEGMDDCREALEELNRKLNGRIAGDSLSQRLKNLTWPFAEEKTQHAIDAVKRYRCIVETALSHDTFVGVAAALSELKQLQRDWKSERFKAILEWLSVSTMEKTQDEVLSTRWLSTSQWILDSATFMQWIDEDSRDDLLWCPGPPGAGKTVTASIIIDHISTTYEGDNVGLAFIYCRYNDQGNQNAVEYISSLIKQLASRKSKVPSTLENLCENLEISRRRPTLSQLTALFLSMCGHFSRVYVIVDALDECGSLKERLKTLETLRILVKASVKVLVTSRGYLEDINLELRSDPKIDIAAQEADIEQYVQAKAKSDQLFMKRVGPEVGKQVVETIVRQAHGMFLMAALQFERISVERTVSKVLKALKTLPSKLEDMYSDCLRRINTQNDSDRTLGLNILMWTTHSKRPLLANELCHALALASDSETIVSHQIDANDLLEMGDLSDVCAGLILIETETNIIRFVHTTMQEYFQKARRTLFPNADAQIAKVCLAYNSLDVFEAGYCTSDSTFEERLDSYPFLSYSSTFWGNHLHEGDDAINNMTIHFLTSEQKLSSTVQVSYVPTYHYDNYSQHFPSRFSSLDIAAAFGLYNITTQLIGAGCDIDAINDLGTTALHLATENGHETVVRLLLNSGANPHVQTQRLISGRGTPGDTPLHRACDKGHDSIVSLLIEYGADIKLKNELDMTPLHFVATNGSAGIADMLLRCPGTEINCQDAVGSTTVQQACKYGHFELVRVLVTHGARVDIGDASGVTPLHNAASGGYLSITRLLLQSNASIDTQDNSGLAALHKAASNGNEAVVQLLLNSSSDPNARDILGGMAIQRAAANGYNATAKLLISGGADPDAPFQFGGTSLQRAAANGHEAVTRALLTGGAKPDPPQQYGGAALQRACANGRESIVSMLLHAGADIHSMNSTGGTPLQWAAMNGHASIVRILLAKGADPNKVHPAGRPALSRALRVKNAVIVDMLLDNGACIESEEIRREIKEMMKGPESLLDVPDTRAHTGTRASVEERD